MRATQIILLGNKQMDTNTTNKFTAQIEVEITPRMIADQIVTAIEGGSNYWMERFYPVQGKELATKEPWYDDEKVWAGDFLIRVEVSDDEKTYDLTPASVQKGLDWLSSHKLSSRMREIVEETGDADTADCFLQACLFEDIVYG